MNICTEHKSEVVYETRYCPACEIQEELDAAKEKITELENKVEELENRE
jgi:polyhydroxyalkanoate synthesis regulator phasin